MKIKAKVISAIIAMLLIPNSAIGSNVCAVDENFSTNYIAIDYSTGEMTVLEIDAISTDEIVPVQSNMPSSREIIGTDDRTVVTSTTTFPYKAIGYLQVVKSDGTYRGTCSAFAYNAVITAAHVVWDKTANTYASSVSISFGKNGDTNPYGTITQAPTQIIIPEEYINTKSTNYDYAIILYSTNITDNFFGFSTSPVNSSTLTLTGYPKNTSSASGGSTNDYRQWTASGNFTLNTYTITYTIDTTGGQSGAPLYDSGNHIVGVHHGGDSSSNTARRIDSTLYSLMRSIKNGTYTG